jgi:hypothetical protein
MVCGQSAFDAFVDETGARWDGVAVASPLQQVELTPDGLRALAARAKSLLGTDYAAMKAEFDRGRSSRTPPPHEHRLIRHITYVEGLAEACERSPDGPVDVDADALTEVLATVELFARWRHHPEWDRLVSTLRDPGEASHTVMLLCLASGLVDNGNAVGFLSDTGQGRIADLWLRPSVLESLEVEVKTPLSLRGPLATPLAMNDAVKLVADNVNRAASSTRGQLNPAHSGIVAIGGFQLGEHTLSMLEEAASDVLLEQPSRKRHLAALVICSVGWIASPGPPGEPQPSIRAVIVQRLVRHPGYAGSLTFVEAPKPQIFGQEG